jgi:hypothetical protein
MMALCLACAALLIEGQGGGGVVSVYSAYSLLVRPYIHFSLHYHQMTDLE